EKDRGEKSAEQTEHDDHLRVHADREEERRRGDDRHRSERGNEGDQMVEDVRRKNISVENQNTGRAKTLPRDAIAPCCGKPAGDDEADPQYRPDRDAHSGRDEIVLEGIFHEKHDPEEKNEAANPGEKFDAEERFPIDWRAWRRRMFRRWPFEGRDPRRGRRWNRWRQRRRDDRRSRRARWHRFGDWLRRSDNEAARARFQFLDATSEVAHSRLERVQLDDADNEQRQRRHNDQCANTNVDSFHQDLTIPSDNRETPTAR